MQSVCPSTRSVGIRYIHGGRNILTGALSYFADIKAMHLRKVDYVDALTVADETFAFIVNNSCILWSFLVVFDPFTPWGHHE